MQAKNELEWYTLLEILLTNTNSKFTLSTRNNQLVIRSTESGINAISERLITALGSADNFRYFLPYQISHKPKPKTLTVVNRSTLNTPIPENTIEAGQAIFNAIFKVALKKLRFSGFFDEESTVKDGVLWSEPVEEVIRPLWELAIKTALATFSDINVDVLRSAWNGDDSHLKVPSGLLGENVIARGLIQQCIGFLNDRGPDDQPRMRVFFDFHRLHQLIFPPVIESVEIPADNDENTHEICIDMDRFTTYLQQLLENGILLRVFKNREDAQIHADPVFLTSRNVVSLQNLYLLVIDRSGSMSADLLRLQNEIRDYIDELRKTDPNSRVRIVSFANDSEAAEFPISQKLNIDQYIYKLKADGGTALFKSVDDELSHLQAANETQNIRMVIFTDGEDTFNVGWDQYDKKISGKISALNENGTLQLLPIGAGSAKEGPLTAMAKTCGSAYTYLKSAASLTGVFKEVAHSQPVKKLIDLVVRLQKSTQQFKLAIPQTGGPHMPHVSFPLLPNEQMVIESGQNQQMKFSVLSVDDIPEQSLVDQLRHFKQRATNIALETSKSITTRISELERLLLEVASLKTIRRSEVVLVANVKDEIQINHINELKRTQYSPQQAAATMSRLGAVTGVTQHLTNMAASTSSATGHFNN